MSMSKFATVEDYKRDRDTALRKMDLAWAREILGATASEEALLMALHKTRYEVTSIEPELRHASRKWLEERNYTRFEGLPWPTDGSLPK